MLKSFLSRARTTDQKPFESDIKTAHQLPYIIVPRSAADVSESDPARFLTAVAEYVEFLLQQAHFQRGEFPEAALQAYHCEQYHRQVLQGGHCWFIRRSMQNLPEVVADVGASLRALEAYQYREIYNSMQRWIATNPKGVTTLTGFVKGIAPQLAALDEPFRALEGKDGLPTRLARWIKAQPGFRTVADEDWDKTLRKILSWNPRRENRQIAKGIAGTDHFLSDPNHVGLGMVAASMDPPEPPISIGSAWHLPVGPDQIAPCHWMRTAAGHRFGVPLDEGFALFEAHPEHPADPGDHTLPADLRKVPNDSIDEIQFHQPHRLGRRLAVVATEHAELAGRICRDLQAAAAIDLLLSRLPAPASVTFASVHKIRRAADKGPEVVIMIVANDGRRGFSAVVNTMSAKLLSEPDHAPLARASQADIAAHAKAGAHG